MTFQFFLNDDESMMWLVRFRFHTWSINRIHRGSGVEFSFLLTHLPNVYLYVMVGPESEPETCVLIGYPRVKNGFSFDSHPDFPQKNKKRNACSLYNFVPKRFFLSHELKLFQQFWLKQRSQIRSKWKHRGHTARHCTRALRGLVDVKPRKQIICNPRFEREIKLVSL